MAVALVLVLALAGCSDEPRAIEQVLARDHHLSEQAEQRIRNGVRWVDALGPAVAARREIDLAGCPGDFRDAYARHAQAWERLAWALRGEAGSDFSRLVQLTSGLLELLAGDWLATLDLLKDPMLKAEVKAAWGDIRKTKEVVETIALGYGARLNGLPSAAEGTARLSLDWIQVPEAKRTGHCWDVPIARREACLPDLYARVYLDDEPVCVTPADQANTYEADLRGTCVFDASLEGMLVVELLDHDIAGNELVARWRGGVTSLAQNAGSPDLDQDLMFRFSIE